MSKTLTGFICATLGAFILTTLAAGWSLLMLGHHATYTLGKVDATLNEINRPCGGKAPCGTLADVAKTLNTVRGTFGQIEIAAQHENRSLSTLDRQETLLVSDLHATMIEAQGTLNASTETLHALTGTLGETQTQIKSVGPLLDAATKTVDTVNDSTATLTPRVQSLLDQAGPVMTNVQGMTQHGDGILADVQKMADKTERDVDSPKPWWMKIGPYANDLIRAGCLLTGRCP